MTPIELPGGLPVAFRPMEPGDRHFIMSSWLRGHNKAGDWPHRLGTPRCNLDRGELGCGCCRFTHRRYWKEHGQVVERLLHRSTVVVACNPADPHQVLGYVVFEPGMLHWIFVKEVFRWDPGADEHPRLGTALMQQAFPDRGAEWFVTCSHWTRSAQRLHVRWRLGYNPFRLEDLRCE